MAKREQARALTREGRRLIREGDNDAGIAKLEEAVELAPLSSIALAAADIMVDGGHHADAVEMYRKAASMDIPDSIPTRDRPTEEHAKEEAAKKIDPLLETTPKVRIQVLGLAPEQVTIDGKPHDLASLDQDLFLDPGVHVIAAKAGNITAEKSVSAELGKKLDVTLKLEEPVQNVSPPLEQPPPAPATPDNAPETGASASTLDIFGWVAVGLGAGALGAMAGTWIAASRTASNLEDDCVDGLCPPSRLGPEGIDDLDRYHTLRETTIVLGVVGGVLAATGVTLLITSSSDDDESGSEVSLDLGPMSMGIHGRF